MHKLADAKELISIMAVKPGQTLPERDWAKAKYIDSQKLKEYLNKLIKIEGIAIGIDVGGTDVKISLLDQELARLKKPLSLKYTWETKPGKFDNLKEFERIIRTLTVFLLLAYSYLKERKEDKQSGRELKDRIEKAPKNLFERILRIFTKLFKLERRIEEALSNSDVKLLRIRILTVLIKASGTGIVNPDSIGISFPDIVIDNKIVGGMTSKTKTVRDAFKKANDEAGYWNNFEEVLTPLADKLAGNIKKQLVMNKDIPVVITNDGNVGSVWAATVLLEGNVYNFAAGTSFGGGLIGEDGQLKNRVFELGYLITYIGTGDYTHETYKEITGCAQSLFSQKAVFKLAKEQGILTEDLQDKEKNILQYLQLLLINREKAENKKKEANLENIILREPAREEIGVIFDKIGGYLALITATINSALIAEKLDNSTIVLFGRTIEDEAGEIVVNKAKEELIQKYNIKDINLERASDLATRKGYTREQAKKLDAIAQSLGAVYLGNMARLNDVSSPIDAGFFSNQSTTVSRVYISRQMEKIHLESLKQELMAGFNALGGLENILKGSNTILVKPSLATKKNAIDRTTTNPLLIDALLGILIDYKVKRIILGEGCVVGHDMEGIFRLTSMYDITNKYGIELVNLNNTEQVEFDIDRGSAFTKMKIAKIVAQSDLIINVPNLKTHAEAVISVAMKNMKGVLSPNMKKDFHRTGVSEGVIELNKILPRQLVIVDAIRAMEGFGPTYGEVIELNRIFISNDPLATDIVSARIMGFMPDDIPVLRLAAEKYFSKTAGIEVIGESIDSVKKSIGRSFRKPVFEKSADLKYVNIHLGDNVCSGCHGVISNVMFILQSSAKITDEDKSGQINFPRLLEKLGITLDFYAGETTRVRLQPNRLHIFVGTNKCITQKFRDKEPLNSEKCLFILGCPPSGATVIGELVKILNRLNTTQSSSPVGALVNTETEQISLNRPLILSVHLPDWEEDTHCGSLLATPLALELAKKEVARRSLLAKSGNEEYKAYKDIDLTKLIAARKVRIAIFHDAGSAKRCSPLSQSQNGTRADLRILGDLNTKDGQTIPLTLILAVAVQNSIYATTPEVVDVHYVSQLYFNKDLALSEYRKFMEADKEYDGYDVLIITSSDPEVVKLHQKSFDAVFGQRTITSHREHVAIPTMLTKFVIGTDPTTAKPEDLRDLGMYLMDPQGSVRVNLPKGRYANKEELVTGNAKQKGLPVLSEDHKTTFSAAYSCGSHRLHHDFISALNEFFGARVARRAEKVTVQLEAPDFIQPTLILLKALQEAASRGIDINSLTTPEAILSNISLEARQDLEKFNDRNRYIDIINFYLTYRHKFNAWIGGYSIGNNMLWIRSRRPDENYAEKMQVIADL
ncbi:MAG: DUF362 domain-containing protein [Candidatus Omnitrophota bacterium]|jgi:uncharacterized protein (DUF362 family)